MHLRLAAVLACLLPLTPAPAMAQDEGPRECKIYDGQSWRSVGSVAMMTCLEGIEQTVSQYNAQGFKFGMWGPTMLSTDRLYYYRSPDGGKNWQALGLQSELAAAIALPPVAEVPPASGSRSDVVAAVADDAVPATDDTPAPVQEPAPPRPAAPALEPRSEVAAVIQPSAQVAAASSMDRRTCNVGTRAGWDQIGILTLRECAQALDRTPDDFDELGFKYGYWSGVFLAANRDEVLSSSDSRSWQPLVRRGGR
jgi:hypothetical protein